MLQNPVQLIDSMRAERVANVGPVECHPHGRPRCTVDDVAVIGDVGQLEAVDGLPERGVKRVLAHGLTGSKRKTGQRPASASYSSGLGPLTSPAFFRKPTPVGTSVGNNRNTGRASSGG